MDFIFESMGVLVEEPWLAAVAAGAFFALFAWARRVLFLVPATAWLLYFFYELAMKLHLLCSGKCGIRVDLLILYPALSALSVAGLAVFAWALVRRRAQRA